ncbi:AzlC family ABC transporter permease [Floccifex sp.]|uniref:AzlC family ABC transporter permease n=1 Tax=Floccifex sp. TaxID=2815810 RepID=UPI003F0EA2E8
MNKKIIQTAFIKSLPILCSYIFVGMAYGLMMNEAGFTWWHTILISFLIYTGAFQFVLIPFLQTGTPLVTVCLSALLINSRQLFYSLTFVDEFNAMGKKKLYMIHTLTDETFAINCTLSDENKKDIMFWIAFLSRCYWMTGGLLGSVIGNLIPWNLEGIDFCMSALFIIILMDQCQNIENKKIAGIGLIVGLVCLLIFGANQFMLPSLILISCWMVFRSWSKA